MNTAETFRLSVIERLEAAAEEIFLLFHRSVAQYEEEIERQRRLLDVVWKPHVKLHRIELQQQHVCKEEDERNPKEKPEPPVMDEQLQEVKQESDDVPVSCSHEGTKDEPVLWNPDVTAVGGHQHQPPTGLADQATGLRGLHLGANTGELSQQIPKQMAHRAPGPTAQEKPHVCTVCSKAFSYKKNLANHMMKSHCPLSCSYADCGKVFLSKYLLKRHITIHRAETLHQCNICGKQFTQACKLKDHIKRHNGEKPYSCIPCGKRFTTKSEWNVHTRVHTGEKPHQCITCGTRFRRSAHLHVHVRGHTGEKPYSCNVCEKAFTTKAALNSHTRIHTGEKPYRCNTCGKQFTQSKSLKYHVRRHTGEKPYSCKACGKCFATNTQWRVHMRVHTGEKPYLCKICGRSFRQSSSLAGHNRRIHSDQAQPAHLAGAQPEEKKLSELSGGQ
ncbi:uncharacterized protein LOC142904871 [Nelusetta ayraudi]|uniref:uncharacterized protein LOC142904871 n=1 Tax=Nelusetta ayraudi TaxID=303726 RepID=UPI003F728A2E